MSSTELGKKDPSYFSGICDIIRACNDSQVLELHLGELSLFRTADSQYQAFSSRKPRAVPPSWDRPSVQERVEGHMDLTPEEKDILAVQEAIAKEEIEANLPLTDPVAHERMQLAELEGQVKGLTAEQVSELDDEELI